MTTERPRKLPDPVLLAMALMILYGLYRSIVIPNGRPYRGNKRLRRLDAKYAQIDSAPSHIVCGNPSPDGGLHCRLEVAHTGWHCHHGPIGWYRDQWAEDDHNNRWGNIPW